MIIRENCNWHYHFFSFVCPEGFSWFNGSCFTLANFTNMVSWNKSKEECEKRNSTLGSLHSAEEEAFVRNGSICKGAEL